MSSRRHLTEPTHYITERSSATVLATLGQTPWQNVCF
ncbi:predicted protein [Botrytis cinerea T4]|uniref:Uncharacterized protein n=1 Tax=Botryotinia fuckeliana (strain T4) TaxID=999810 RepID=G2XNP2_BOTF4|nr:predicted protein [Botrytis cinerea T4]